MLLKDFIFKVLTICSYVERIPYKDCCRCFPYDIQKLRSELVNTKKSDADFRRKLYQFKRYSNGYYWGDSSKNRQGFSTGMRGGIGAFLWNDGTLFIGYWFADHRYKGMMIFPKDNHIYNSEYIDNEYDGRVFEYSNGLELIANYRRGKIESVVTASASFVYGEYEYNKRENTYTKKSR